MKTYIIYREEAQEGYGAVHCTVEHKHGGLIGAIGRGVTSRYQLPHVERHSPDGFEIGYNGSGSADLALSILCDHFGETPTRDQIYHGQYTASGIYQRFKERYIATLDRERGGSITSEQIERFLQDPNIRALMARSPSEVVSDAQME